MNKKNVTIVVLVALIVAGTIFVVNDGMLRVLGFVFNPGRGTVSEFEPTLDITHILTREEAIEDIDYILNRVRTRHPACIRGLPEDLIEQSRIEKENLPEEVSVLQLWQAATRILAVLGDSHTNAWLHIDDYMYRIPAYFEFTDGVLYLTDDEFESCAVINIGGIKPDELYQTYKSQFPHEREEFVIHCFPNMVRWRHMLAFMGVDVSGGVAVVFETADGEVTVTYDFIEREVTEDDETTFASHEIDGENSVGVFTVYSFNFDDFEVFREAVRDFFTDVKDNEVQTIVVDLRENLGGRSGHIYYFLRYLDVERYFDYENSFRYGPFVWTWKSEERKNNKFDELLFSGDVYVLTSVQTYSAATIFAFMISDNGIGKIVGEASGQVPSFYAGVLPFQTPNAKLQLGVSGGFSRRPDKSKCELFLEPDYPVTADEALEKVYMLLQQKNA
ncbi:MAG: S41 family peptidase [Oscillospiraceae bacterium]|nr:S41 family peptidase [Oscillospiraceae bacterium]